MESKQTKGRQKIEMKKIEDEEDRLISFSKRRSGIYKKASELSTLCGTEIGIIVYSPSEKPFTYGNPCLESVANRYLNQNPPPADSTIHLVEAHRRVRIHELNQQYNELVNQLEVEKKRGEMLKRVAKPMAKQAWWEAPVDELSVPNLERLNMAVEELHKSVSRRDVRMGTSSSTSGFHAEEKPPQAPYPFTANGVNQETSTSSFPHGHGAYGYGHGLY
ncbi:agamous-like MADS-box protein AGL62 [Malania oleifera]|uniref:agamous-like MADS-box protein AGL62 n=1 Tax=Malania oleifera TaxID=397392 RepID=UPI0025AE623A|nr:agamous-like MADS-box protein AGL62 [Malania oleifera]